MTKVLHKPDYTDAVRADAIGTCEAYRVGIFIVAYNADKLISQVLDRIPDFIAERVAEIFIIDDCSKDATFSVASAAARANVAIPIRVFRTPSNQGYGGNQQLGYQYALERGFDIAVLLHGDGQYAPEYLPQILAEYSRHPDVAAVYGSRFMPPRSALKGGMPLYKWVGNRILTRLQQRLIGSSLSEMHSGYRSYKLSSLAKVPFQLNSKDFDFDSDIIIQFAAAGLKIIEVPIPTYYGDEICYVNGMKYASQCLRSALRYRAMQFEIFYDKKYDIPREGVGLYQRKSSPKTTHGYVRQLNFAGNEKVFDVGGGDGKAIAIDLAERGLSVTVLDQTPCATSHSNLEHVICNLDSLDTWTGVPPSSADVLLALDVIEHLRDPEHGIDQMFRALKAGGRLVASTGNVAFLLVRVMLAFGFFNYGRKGILDLTHRCLFTIGTFSQLLARHGFKITKKTYFGVPLLDTIGGRSWFIRTLDQLSHWLAQKLPSLFAYQVMIEAERRESIHDLMAGTFALPKSSLNPVASPVQVYQQTQRQPAGV